MVSVGIAEASRILGLSQDTVRKRVKSGEIPGTKHRAAGGFRWLVNLPSVDTKSGETPSDDRDLVQVLKNQVEDLKDQLINRTREISELHQLLGARSLGAGVERGWWQFWKR